MRAVALWEAEALDALYFAAFLVLYLLLQLYVLPRLGVPT
jgi:hypothetical protein